jgi:hypothetical protein
MTSIFLGLQLAVVLLLLLLLLLLSPHWQFPVLWRWGIAVFCQPATGFGHGHAVCAHSWTLKQGLWPSHFNCCMLWACIIVWHPLVRCHNHAELSAQALFFCSCLSSCCGWCVAHGQGQSCKVPGLELLCSQGVKELLYLHVQREFWMLGSCMLGTPSQ